MRNILNRPLKSWIALLELTEQVLLTCIHVLGFDSPERM